jgi:hypothetical protein
MDHGVDHDGPDGRDGHGFHVRRCLPWRQCITYSADRSTWYRPAMIVKKKHQCNTIFVGGAQFSADDPDSDPAKEVRIRNNIKKGLANLIHVQCVHKSVYH